MEYIKGLTSIIICCYNVASWLRKKRLLCILQQTYPQIEVILVDDGSTDDTPELLRYLATKDSRLRIITHPNNQGLGNARNTGLDDAKGEFIWYYDVDDEASLELVEKNVNWMSCMETDINIFSFERTFDKNRSTKNVIFKKRLLESNKALQDIYVELFLGKYGNGYTWNKFYRHSFLEQHRFRFGDQRILQDELFIQQICPFVKRVYISNEILYHYFVYEQGNNRSHYIPHRYDIFLSVHKGFIRLFEQWNIKSEDIVANCHERLYRGMYVSIMYDSFHPENPLALKEKKNEIKRILLHPESQECIDHQAHIPSQSIKEHLYLKVLQLQNASVILMLPFLSKIIRYLKKDI